MNLLLVAELSGIGGFYPFNSGTDLPSEASHASSLKIVLEAFSLTSSRMLEIGTATLRFDLLLF